MDNVGFAELLEKLYRLESLSSSQFDTDDEQEYSHLSESMSNSAIPGIIGKTAKAKSNKIFFDDKNPSEFSINVPPQRTKTEVICSDVKGNVVHEFPEDKLMNQSGDTLMKWSGESSKGKVCRKGNYFINALYSNNFENDIKADVFISGKITNMIFEPGGVSFEVNSVKVPYLNMVDIYEN